MILSRKLSNLFACCSLLAVCAWAVGCAEETVEEPVGNGEIEAPAEEPGEETDLGFDAPEGDAGLEAGSATGAGTDVPDPLEGTEAGEAIEESEPAQPEPETETP